MAESSPNVSSPGGERRQGSSAESSSAARGEGRPRESASRASVPPSEPRGSRASLSAIDAQVDGPARMQLIVALILGLVLVAIPLYLWRRPRAESIAVNANVSQDAGAVAVEGAPPVIEEKVAIGEPRSTCHDPGPKRTPPEQCDHLSDIEKALAKAIEESAACVPKDAGGGTIVYAAEVTLGAKKRSLVVSTPKDGRSIKSAKVVSACHGAVKAKLAPLTLDGLKHEHHRYRISVTATYPGSARP